MEFGLLTSKLVVMNLHNTYIVKVMVLILDINQTCNNQFKNTWKIKTKGYKETKYTYAK